ncbi:MAG: hypothetical protein IJ587_03970 [Synergistaceae bacterium]|nr:hypothetical protein [Synergistaceae bacterium]
MPDELFSVTDVKNLTEAPSRDDGVQSPTAEPVKQKQDPEFLAVKSTFTPSRGDMGGGFCVIFEGKTGKTVFQIFWLAKPYANGQIPEVSKDWRSFVKRLPSLGPLDKDWSEKLQSDLKGILTLEEKKKLYENYTKVKIRQLESIFRRTFETTAQCVFTATTEAEPVGRNELERAKIIKPLPPSPEQLAKMKREQEEKEKAEQEEREREEAKKEGNFEGTVIKCSPVVDPVKGKASSEIVPGDIIGVKIEGEGTSALVNKYLIENNIEPFFPVDEIREMQGKKFIYVKISDEIRGYVNITKDIKMQVKEQAGSEQPKKNVSFLGDLFFFGLLGIALVALLFVIRYFFL